MQRNYKTALSLLDSCRKIAGEAASKGIPPPPGKKGNPVGLTGMGENLHLLGHLDADLNRLNVIHVAGTKGKGTTCVFTDCFLRAHGERTEFPQKIGLYTSPHLTSVRECLRINFEPISEELFTKYFFEVWEKLSEDALQNPKKIPTGFLQLMTLISFHTFFREEVDVAILETNSGGTYDATNIAKPNVVGITRLGIDHVQTLGSTIESIAWHKSGIFKPGIPAFSSIQEPAATAVLQERASEKGVQLSIVNVDDMLSAEELRLEKVQQQNASLALSVSNALLKEKAPKEHSSLIPQDVLRGIELFSWPGRMQRISDGNNHWFLDIAHNEMSLVVVGQWFAKNILETQSKTPRILVFSHASTRDGVSLVKCIAKSLQESGMQLDHVIFCTLEESRNFLHHSPFCEVSQDMQDSFAAAWKSVDPTAQISSESTIKGALNLARAIGDRRSGMQTLITGDTRLVGAALLFLGSSTL